jgi:hypothetical protein
MIPESSYDINIKVLYYGKGFKKFKLLRNVRYWVDGYIITVPAGFLTDGRSSGPLSGIFPTWGRAARAWLLHDWMYVMDYGVKEFGWSKKKARKYADTVMYEQSMKHAPNEYIKNILCYYAVRLFGRKVYEQDREVLEQSKKLFKKHE